MEKLELEKQKDVVKTNNVEVSKNEKKKGKAPFVVSIVMASIAFAIFILAIGFDCLVVKVFKEVPPALIIFVIALFALPIIVGIVSEIFAIISFANAAVLFKKEKTPKSITMFVIGLVELTFLIIVIAVLALLFNK